MKELLSLAKLAVSSASEVILKHYDDYTVVKKEDNSPLTSADIAANDKIFEILGKSGIEICSEERILDNLGSLFWLVDPIDGTREFIKKNGEFCVCIALIKDGRPVLSVISIPVTGEVFYSSGNGEVYKNGSLLTTKKSPNLAFMGRSGNSKKRERINAHFNFEPKRLGSAIKFCRLAENEGAIYARFGDSSIWDNAAGDFLVEQSGGLMIDLKTREKPLYNQKILSNNFICLDKNNAHLKDKILEFIDANF
ncbi:MAG: 3'(2'),5'-bisphosphate nucleotidase CysQ [Campylobacteraceae bacterium]|nr:3'(2'),5'-bisphosphate nucleotidase CysQ [Campylobacteraceae bacterium]